MKDKVWCATCRDKKPIKMTIAHYLVPMREKPYDLSSDGFTIDLRVVGVCKKCLDSKNNFQKCNIEPVDVNHRHLVKKNI